MKISFIGAGKVGKGLGLYFKRYGLDVVGYYSKTAQSAHTAALLTETKAFNTLETLVDSSEVVFITAPDQALAEIDSQAFTDLSEHGRDKKKLWIHVSGAHSSNFLTQIKTFGCPVGSMHPLLSFGDPSASARQLDRAVFTVEGTPTAIDMISTILKITGGQFSLISAENKPLYHAGACVLSNYMATLIDSGMRYFEAVGMKRDVIFEAIEPLIAATLRNIREKDTVEALTGPIVRGDFNTIKTHLEAIDKHLPTELGLYKTLADKTVDMISGKRINQNQAVTLRRLLGEN